MTVAATSAASTAQTTTTTDTNSAARTSLANNFDMFLTLLTAQMKNQDPLSPLDNNQFTSQLVQMTGVEQQLASNDYLKQLVSNTGTGVAGAVDLIGKQVRAQGADAQLANGKAQWNYQLDKDTSDMKISVLDSGGNTVDVVSASAADSKAGDHTFSWDGKSSITGANLPAGAYTLQLTTKNSTGDTITTGSTYLQGTVTGVEQSNGQALITINGTKVPLSQVISVTAPSSTSTTSTQTDQTSVPAA